MNESSVLVLGAEVRAIRKTDTFSLLLLVEMDGKVYTCIHSVEQDRDVLLTYLGSRTDKFGEVLRTHGGALKPLRRGRSTPGTVTTGVVRGWMVDRHPKFGIQAWASMEIETQWGTSNVPVLISEAEFDKTIEKIQTEGETVDETWSAVVQGTVELLAEELKLGSVWPIQVGYHGKHELAPTARAASDEPDLAEAGGSQLPKVSAW